MSKTKKTPLTPEQKKKRRKQEIKSIGFFFIKIGVIALTVWAVFTYVFGVRITSGEDMYPRVRDGDVLLYYRMVEDLHIGDVVVFEKDGEEYAGRIIAQTGDTVNIDDEGQLFINGAVQSEEIFYATFKKENKIKYPLTINDGEYFILCDFRTNATDSREYGPVSREEIKGSVIAVFRRRGI